MLNAIAITEARQQLYEDAAVHFKRTLEIHRRLGTSPGPRRARATRDAVLQAQALEDQGDDLEKLGRIEEAREHLGAADAIHSDLGHPRAGQLRERPARAAG